MKFISFFAVFIFLFFSCKKDSLDRTIFIPDKDYPELPAYSEWGYNSFGAFYERNTFVSTDRIVPCKMVAKDDTLNFVLSGLWYHQVNASLTFSIPHMIGLKTLEDLSVLHNLVIDLKENCIVKWKENNQQTTFDVLSGQLWFKRYQLLRVDETVNRIILSGTFEIKFLKKGLPESFSNGRFDLGISTENFIYITN